MRRIVLSLILSLILFNCAANAMIGTYTENKKFGLVDLDTQEKITKPVYSKLIRLGDESFLFMKKSKYGIISNDGTILVEPTFTNAERLANRFAKLGKKGKYCLYDEKANLIAGLEYSSISLLYGRMFLVQKNYKYGLISYEGDILMAPVADDIYMPKANILRMSYEGQWVEIETLKGETLSFPKEIAQSPESAGLKVTTIIQNPIASTGYGIVSFSDYFIKLFSSISPSYEKTIDELVLEHGADTASILMKSSWLVKFPFVYGKNYINNLKAPNNGPLSDVKANLKKQLEKQD